MKYDKSIIKQELSKKADMHQSIGAIFNFIQDQWKLSNVSSTLTKEDKYKLFLYAWASYYIEKN